MGQGAPSRFCQLLPTLTPHQDALRSSTWWNVFVLLSWHSWSPILFVICLIAVVWQTSGQTTPLPYLPRRQNYRLHLPLHRRRVPLPRPIHVLQVQRYGRGLERTSYKSPWRIVNTHGRLLTPGHDVRSLHVLSTGRLPPSSHLPHSHKTPSPVFAVPQHNPFNSPLRRSYPPYTPLPALRPTLPIFPSQPTPLPLPQDYKTTLPDTTPFIPACLLSLAAATLTTST